MKLTKSNDTIKQKNMKLCFSGFDTVSKKLIISLFKANELRPVVLDDFNFKSADICLFNYESIADKNACNHVKESLLMENKHLMLFTSDDSISSNDQITVVLKPKDRGGVTDYLLDLKNIIQSTITKISTKEVTAAAYTKPILAKSIINKHLSNAINPSQIQLDKNRFHAQKHVGSHADIDMNNELELKKIQLNPENYLFHYLKEAFRKSKQNKQLMGLNTVHGVFVVDAENNYIHTNKQVEEIKNLHNIPLFGDTQLVLEPVNKSKLNKLNRFDYEPFIWQSAIKASKGRISSGVDHNQPIMLNGWPNLTHLLIFKYAIQIISLWSRGDYSLVQTPKILKIPQRYATTVYTALDSLDLVKRQPLKNDKGIHLPNAL